MKTSSLNTNTPPSPTSKAESEALGSTLTRLITSVRGARELWTYRNSTAQSPEKMQEATEGLYTVYYALTKSSTNQHLTPEQRTQINTEIKKTDALYAEYPAARSSKVSVAALDITPSPIRSKSSAASR